METKGKFQAKDWTEHRGEHFTVIADTGKKDPNGSHIWEAKCDCGKTFDLSSSRIHRVRSCGCLNRAKRIDYKGSKVRGFTAINKTGKRENGYAVWLAVCDYCGQRKEFPSYYFKRGHCSCECDGWKQEYADKIGRKPMPNNQSHVNIIYNHYRRGAQERSLPFELTKEQVRVLIEQDCHYCGQKPVVRYTAQGCAGEYAWNGIDRVDNQKGYTIENCVPCCKQCNFAKRDCTLDDFVAWIDRVYNNLKKSGVMP